MAGWSPDIQVLKSDVSGLLQLMSYVRFKVKAGSGGVVLGPMKYFSPVICRADYSTHFEGPRYACLNLKNGGLESRHTSSQIGRIRSPSFTELCHIQG